MSQNGPVQLGEYRLLEQLGQGGMAMVYRAERVAEAGFKKTVAIKRMIPQYRRDPSLLERFAAEARTNARLDHPNLVAVVDFGVSPEPYLVMEFVEGISLAALLERLHEQHHMLEIAAACFIGAEAASGLDHAHRKRDDQGNPLGIVHRDVSPQNVLLSNEGAVKVSDFGLVKAADNVVQTGSGIPIGKLSYMAPEQSQHQEVDARADVFSLGIVIWEMLAMRVLMPPNDPVTASQMLQRCEFDPPSSYNPEVPPELDAIVMGCLVADPTQRTPSMQALGLGLREILHEVAPGYGRDQLARLLGWAFPERGWELDEPHETAAQPSKRERMSMPSQETAMEAMQRVSSPPEDPSVKTQVDVQQAQPTFSAPPVAAAGQAAPPSPIITGNQPALTTGGHPMLSAPGQAAPPAKRSWMPWILIGGAVALLGVALLVIVLALVVFSASSGDDEGPAPPPPSVGPADPPAQGQSESHTTRIESNAPGAVVFSGTTRLGRAPVDVSRDILGSDPLVVLAPGHRPSIVQRDQLMNQPYFLVSLAPSDSPERAVLIRSPHPGTAHVAFGGAHLGRVPGMVLAPATPMGGTAQIEVRFDRGGTRRLMTAGCEAMTVCELDAGEPRRGRRTIEW